MPFMQLRVAPLQNPERYPALARALTALAVRLLHQPLERTSVAITDLPAAQWYVGGEDLQQPVAQLEITLSAGSCSAADKAAFVRQAFDELQRLLAHGGPLEPASCVMVHELPPGDGGQGGITHAARLSARTAPTCAA